MVDDPLPLEVKNLTKVWRNALGFSRLVAVRDLSFRLGPGRVLGLIGPNGSGKTTAIRCLLGLVRASRGEVRILGARPLSAAARREVGFAPERFEPSPARSGRRTLELLGVLSGLTQEVVEERSRRLLERFELAPAADRAVGGYSKGMRRRLAIAQALLSEPRLVVLDEPFDGLDPLGALLVREEIESRAAAGTAFVVSSHQLADVEAVATDVVVMHHGVVVAQGEKATVLDRPGVARVEIGGLDDAALTAVLSEAERRGGRVTARGSARESLEDLFRRLVKGGRQ